MPALTSRTQVAAALQWPVFVHNGSLWCGRVDDSGDDPLYCLARLTESPEDPMEMAEFSAARLAAVVIRHIRESHT